MKKWIKWTLIGAGSITLLLVATLAIHIYMVTGGKPKNPTANWALVKLDFHRPLDSLQRVEAYKAMRSIEGIEKARFGSYDRNIVASYDMSSGLNHQLVFEKFTAKTDIGCALFKPSMEQLAGSCPVIDKNSISYKLGSYFEGLFASK